MAYRDVIQADSPIHWWRFRGGSALVADEGSTGILADAGMTGASQALAFFNSYSGIAADGGSYGLAAGNQLFAIATDALQSLNIPVPPLSFEAWLYVAGFNNTTSNSGIIGFGPTGDMVGMQSNPTGFPVITGQGPAATPFLRPGRGWTHFGFVVTSTAVTYYVNGVLGGTGANTFPSAPRMGMQVGSTGTASFPLYVCEVAAYQGGLTAAQFAAHFAAADTLRRPMWKSQINGVC
jgi:hypothetical protein